MPALAPLVYAIGYSAAVVRDALQECHGSIDTNEMVGSVWIVSANPRSKPEIKVQNRLEHRFM